VICRTHITGSSNYDDGRNYTKEMQGDPAKRKKVEWKEFSRGFRAPILAGPTRTQYLGIWLAVLRQPEYVVYRFWKVET
jgi:hypothetical protein